MVLKRDIELIEKERTIVAALEERETPRGKERELLTPKLGKK